MNKFIFKTKGEMSTSDTYFTVLKSGNFDDFGIKYNIAQVRVKFEMKICSKYFHKKLVRKIRNILNFIKYFFPVFFKEKIKIVKFVKDSYETATGYCLVKIGGCGVAGFSTESDSYAPFNNFVSGVYYFIRPPITRTPGDDPRETKELEVKILAASSREDYKVFIKKVKVEISPIRFIETPFKIIKLYAQKSKYSFIVETIGGGWSKFYSILSPISLRTEDEGEDFAISFTKSKTIQKVIEEDFYCIHTGNSIWENFQLKLKIGFWAENDGETCFLDKVGFSIQRVNIVGLGYKGLRHYARFYEEITIEPREENNSNIEKILYLSFGGPAALDTFQRGEILRLIIRVYGHIEGEKGNYKMYFSRGTDECALIAQCWGLKCPVCGA